MVAILINAAEFTINTSGITYSPNDLTVEVGDVITIQASGTHPLVQVSEATWNSNGKTELPGGWGTKTASYTFTVETEGVIYYVCANHVGAGMKGKITVNAKTSVNTIESEKNVLVFPLSNNPGSVQVILTDEMKQNSTIMIYNVSGQLQHTFSLQEKNSILNTSLKKGVYFYQIVAIGNRTQGGKFIVMSNL